MRKEWTTHQLRSSAAISDLEMVQAINTYRQENNDNWHQGRLPTKLVWVFTDQLSDHFDIHPHRISSKIRRMNHRGLTDGGGWDSRGDITLKAGGESLLRGRDYKVVWCGLKRTHFSHDFNTEIGEELTCMGYEVRFRSKPEPDEEFVWPEDDEEDYERTV